MFDWDRDYSELVEQPRSADSGPKAAACASKASPPSSVRRASSRILPVTMAAAVFLAGLAYEKADAARSVLSFGMAGADDALVFEGGALTPDTEANSMVDVLPPELLVYENAQYQRFMLGLRTMTMPELQSYARKTRADLDAAPVGLAPFYRDALFLLEREALQRGI